MTTELSNFAARLREAISSGGHCFVNAPISQGSDEALPSKLRDATFGALALELFALQFKYNAAYRKICEARLPRRSVAKAGGLTPKIIEHWTRIPSVPTAAFKELELTSLAPGECTAVFHSSGTTEQKPSRHFHSAESLAVYEASLWVWFQHAVIGAPNSDSACFQPGIVRADSEIGAPSARQFQLVILTPPPVQAPHSSLVHMFETVRRKLGASETAFVGKLATDGAWTLDFARAIATLGNNPQSETSNPKLILGTAFSFVHLLDYLAEKNLRFDLPASSRVMETGGYKNRSRSMPKAELHQLIAEKLGVPPSHIICEYGMSELSSQAYDGTIQANILDLPHAGPLPKERENCRQSAGESVRFRNSKERTMLFPLPEGEGRGEGKRAVKSHYFQFPPWARVQIISPETGREVAEGETGLIRVFDLANVFSVMAIQTEDLAIRRGDGFELIGRVAQAEPRGCSLMMLEGSAPSLPQSKWGIDKAMPSKK